MLANEFVSIYENDFDFQELCKRDLEKAITSSKLSLSDKNYSLLLIQSVQGHAANSHKAFYGHEPYLNNLISDIIWGAGLDVKKVKNARQRLIDEVLEWVELAKQDKVNKLLTSQGEPLLGVECLKEFTINPEYVLKGMILAGLMDSYEWRMKTLREYKMKTIDEGVFNLGGGETHLVNRDNLLGWHDSPFEYLSKTEINNETIQYLKEINAITAPNDPKAEVAYVRRKIGKGTSDDAAFIFMGRMYKKKGWQEACSAFLGGVINDGIDTYEKCVAQPLEGGYDEKIGLELKEEFPDLVSDDEVKTLIYYAAKGNSSRGKNKKKYDQLVSSSHKRLIELVCDNKPTIEHHLNFLKTGKYQYFSIGFEKLSSDIFYKTIQRRMDHYQLNHQ